MDRCRVLAVTGGHSFDLDAFRSMMTDICDERRWLWAHAVQPSAQQWLDGKQSGRWDAIVCHDIPGLSLKRGDAPHPVGPTDEQKQAITTLLENGQGSRRHPSRPGGLAGVGRLGHGNRRAIQLCARAAPREGVAVVWHPYRQLHRPGRRSHSPRLHRCRRFHVHRRVVLLPDLRRRGRAIAARGRRFRSRAVHLDLRTRAGGRDGSTEIGRAPATRATSSPGRRSAVVVPSCTSSPATAPRPSPSRSTAGCWPTRSIGCPRRPLTNGLRRTRCRSSRIT